MTLRELLNQIDFDYTYEQTDTFKWVFHLEDLQEANLGDIQSVRFQCEGLSGQPFAKLVMAITARTEIYWEDYIIRPCDDFIAELTDKDIPVSWTSKLKLLKCTVATEKNIEVKRYFIDMLEILTTGKNVTLDGFTDDLSEKKILSTQKQVSKDFKILKI